jgi:hypothetical protein
MHHKRKLQFNQLLLVHPSGGGIINDSNHYAPVYNPDTGNPTMDAYMRRLRVNLGLPV